MSSKIIYKNKIHCEARLLIKDYIRPKGTYFYNDNLEKISFTKEKAFYNKRGKTITVYFTNKVCPKKGHTMRQAFEYSCSDKYEGISDLSLVATGLEQGEFLDPWTQQLRYINCKGQK